MAASDQSGSTAMYDLVIRDALIVDGTRTPAGRVLGWRDNRCSGLRGRERPPRDRSRTTIPFLESLATAGGLPIIIAARKTLTRYSLPIGPIVNCLATREEGARAVAELMRGEASDPTALLCYNHICAFGVLLGLADRGLAAGRDCAVIGLGNIARAALYRPALTTIAIDARRIGEEARRTCSCVASRR
jgi:hypothetical protein